MKKRVLLLAVSCKNGGLCPGGIDMDNPKEWIRIVKDDGCAGAVQGHEIDFAKPLDVIEFDGRPMPQGKQRENWVIDNHSCRIVETKDKSILKDVFLQYGYHGFWGNYRSSLNENEFEAITAPSESILLVTNVKVYMNENDKAKIDFEWGGSLYPIKWIAMTDQEYYPRINDGETVNIDKALIVISIPKECDYIVPQTGERKAFKFVSKIFPLPIHG